MAAVINSTVQPASLETSKHVLEWGWGLQTANLQPSPAWPQHWRTEKHEHLLVQIQQKLNANPKCFVNAGQRRHWETVTATVA